MKLYRIMIFYGHDQLVGKKICSLVDVLEIDIYYNTYIYTFIIIILLYHHVTDNVLSSCNYCTKCLEEKQNLLLNWRVGWSPQWNCWLPCRMIYLQLQPMQSSFHLSFLHLTHYCQRQHYLNTGRHGSIHRWALLSYLHWSTGLPKPVTTLVTTSYNGSQVYALLHLTENLWNNANEQCLPNTTKVW